MYLCVFLLVYKHTINPEDSVSILQASLFSWTLLFHVPDEMPCCVFLNTQVESIALLGFFGHFTLSGLENRSHLCQTGWKSYMWVKLVSFPKYVLSKYIIYWDSLLQNSWGFCFPGNPPVQSKLTRLGRKKESLFPPPPCFSCLSLIKLSKMQNWKKKTMSAYGNIVKVEVRI